MGDGFGPGIITAVIVVSLVYIGYMLCAVSLGDDCRSLGKTKIYGQVYECRKLDPAAR